MSDWLYCYGELAGKSHGTEVPCQDKALCMKKNGVTVATLSDGCGSSPFSQYGSDATTKALCELFCEHFDELVNASAMDTRKMILNAIIDGLRVAADEISDKIEEYKSENPEKYENYIRKYSEEAFKFSCLYATAIFVAVKDDIFILGQIGDGYCGAVVNNQIKIVLEEKKDDVINGTLYPANIYQFALEDENWYGDVHFQLKKTKASNITGFILTTDGVDTLIDMTVPFQKKYATAVNKMFRSVIAAESFEAIQTILKERMLPQFVENSKTRDDCGVAMIVKPEYELSETDGYFITKYERPERTAEEADLEGEAGASGNGGVLDFNDSVIPAINSDDKSADEYSAALSEISKVVSRHNGNFDEALRRLTMKGTPRSKILIVLELYRDVLSAIEDVGYYVIEDFASCESMIANVYEIDLSLELDTVGMKFTKK